MSKNAILTSIKGCNSVADLPKFELIQAFMHVIVTCKYEKDRIRMKGLECSQDFSHYKSIGIFPDVQGQLTLQSMVGSAQISNLFEILKLSLLPAKNKEDPIKNEGARVFKHLIIMKNLDPLKVIEKQ